MPTTDLLIYLLGCYGIAKFITMTNQSLRIYVLNKCLHKSNVFWEKLSEFLEFKVFNCPPCCSFWVAAATVTTYFNAEIFITKLLICFATFALAYFISEVTNDID